MKAAQYLHQGMKPPARPDASELGSELFVRRPPLRLNYREPGHMVVADVRGAEPAVIR